MTVTALAVAICLKRMPDQLMLIGGPIDTWELQKSAGLESQWLDKSQPPQLSISEAYKIAQDICNHLNSARDKTGVGYWKPVTIAIERLSWSDDNRWAYFVRVEGSDYPRHFGQSLVEHITCMILLDKTVVFDSGSCPNKLLDVMKSYPEIIDGAPTVNKRPVRDNGGGIGGGGGGFGGGVF